YERKSPSLDLTIEMLNKFISTYGGCITIKRIDEIRKSDLISNDIIISIRGNSKGAYQVAKTAKKIGLLYYLLMDDNLFDTPPFYRYKKRVTYANKIAQIADCIIVFNKFVSDLCKERFNCQCVQLDSICELNNFNIVKDNKKGITKIVFAASADHNLVFEKYITPIMKNVERRASTKIQFDFIGVSPKTASEIMEINYLLQMPIKKYREFIKKGQYDLGIAVIEDDYFSNCKYVNKFLEYTLSDIVGIYSDTSLYKQVIIDKFNGFLTKNTPECWEEVLVYAIDNPSKVTECLVNAKEYVRQKHNSKLIIKKLNDYLPELETYRANIKVVNGIWKIQYAYFTFALFEKINQFFHYLLSEGIYQSLNKIIQRKKNKISYYSKKEAKK
ncbi:MAG: hypothetical protein PHP65_02715, partial [Bacilli bacterium]|nr:hypothetical protein [Bacilli bacterium]